MRVKTTGSMSNYLVKILSSDNGEPRELDFQYWCLVHIQSGSPGTFCTDEFFGYGESGCEYKTKKVKRGGITCPRCLEKIRWAKSIKL